MSTGTDHRWRWRSFPALLVVVTTVVTVTTMAQGRAAAVGDAPLPVTPYGGFDPTLTRAPYITDLTQNSASVDWATTASVPGSAMVVPAVAGTCPASIAWSASALAAPTALPGPVNPTASTGTMTGWAFAVTGVLGTTNEFQSTVAATGLSPGTRYCYTVFSSTHQDLLPAGQQVQTFTTLDPVNTASTAPVSFDVIDDTGENYLSTSSVGANDIPYPNGINPDQASLYNQIGRSGADFLISAGDIGYSGSTQSNFGDLEQTGTQPEVSNVFGRSYFPQAGGIPTFAASGDHGQVINPLKIFPTATTAAASGGTYALDSYSGVDGITASSPDDWYAFSTGNVRVYVLDGAWGEGTTSGKLGTTTGSLCGPAGTPAAIACEPYQADADEHWRTNTAEYRWLAADLAAHPGGVKFAVIHFPVRSVSATQPSDPYLQNSPANPNAGTSLERLLAGHGVGMAFGGHAHTYQRIIPNGFQQNQQMIQYVTGAGGGTIDPVVGGSCTSLQSSASIYALGWNPSTSAASTCGVNVPSPTSAADVYSFLKVTVVGDRVTVAPTNAAGKTFDVQTYTLGSNGSNGSSGSSGSSGGGGTSPISPAPPVIGSPGVSSPGALNTACVRHLPSGSVVGAAATAGGSGYYEVDGQGDVAAFGDAPCFGATTGIRLNKPIVGIALDPATGGYWLVASDGGIFSFNAPFHGSTGSLRLNKPIIGIAAEPSGAGYWFVASDGGVFAFGAHFYGSTGALALNKPIVGMAPDPATGGYWLVASDGGVFSFHAPFLGSTGSLRLNRPIVGMAPLTSGAGYRLIASDGGVFDFNAPFHGSTGSLTLNRPIITGLDDPVGDGYWLIASDGGVFSFHAPFLGSAA